MNHRTLEIDMKALAQELITWRLRAGLTQTEAAAKFGVSRYSILRCETQRYIGLATAYRLSAQLAKALRKESLEML